MDRHGQGGGVIKLATKMDDRYMGLYGTELFGSNSE